MFTTPVQIRFNDIDLFGHLNNTVYLQFLDQGKYAYLSRYLTKGFGEGGTAPVVANINCNFLAPTLIDEELTVLTKVESVADSSFVLYQTIVNSKGETKVEARTVMVNIDLSTHRPATVSDEWRRRFAESD